MLRRKLKERERENHTLIIIANTSHVIYLYHKDLNIPYLLELKVVTSTKKTKEWLGFI